MGNPLRSPREEPPKPEGSESGGRSPGRESARNPQDTTADLQAAEDELRAQTDELASLRLEADAQQRRYQELFEFAPDPYLVTDCFSSIQEANAAAAELLNVDQGFLKRKPLTAFVPQDERSLFREVLSSLTGLGRLSDWEVTLKPRAREPIWIAASVVVVNDEQGEPAALRWALRDITRRKQAESELRVLNEELDWRVNQRTAQLEVSTREKERLYQLEHEARVKAEQVEAELRASTQAKDELLGIVSHELRTPVTVISGGLRILSTRRDSLPEGAQAELLDTIWLEAEHLQQLIEELLAFSRVELGEDVETEPVMLQHVLEKVLREQAAHTDPTHEVKVRIDQNLPPVLAHPTYLEQVVGNLLANASKYSPRIEPIEIEARREQNKAIVAVLDRGPGVSDTELEKIFRHFYRSHSASGTRGMGMGLTVCKRLVEAQGGRIWARMRDGGGLEVSFSLDFLESSD